LGGSRRFCVQCGHELKQEARFCVACGHVISGTGQQPTVPARGAEVTTRRHEVTATMPAPGLNDPVRPGSSATGSAWPFAEPYDAAGASPQPERRGGSPPPGVADGVSGAADQPAVGRSRSRWPLVLGAVVLLAAGTAAVVLFVQHPSHASLSAHTARRSNAVSPSAKSTAASSSSQSSAQQSSAQPPEEQAAAGLAALLAQSVADRSSIVAAVSDVSQCGPTLSQDQKTFEEAAASRQNLLSQLAGLPARSALPAHMLQALTAAWQASASADQDLAQWAQDETSQGCTQNAQADPHFEAAAAPDDQATTDKMAFASQWDPIAAEYGLTAYQWNQL
jgi:zinc-ribbon domain